MSSFKSDTVLGDKYTDNVTGLTGVATGVTFYLHACERVTLEFLKEGEIKYESFDAPRLTHVVTQKEMQSDRTGGPGGLEARQAPAVRR